MEGSGVLRVRRRNVRILNGDAFVCLPAEEPHENQDGTMAEIKEDIIDEVGSECDREVSKIDFSGVAMRSKKMRAVEKNMPRPMSWEGELSDTEMKQVMRFAVLNIVKKILTGHENNVYSLLTPRLLIFRRKIGQ